MSTLIHLNVGGTAFTVTRCTLCRDPSGVLAAMFNQGRSGLAPAEKDVNGAYFIDRDPKPFAVILGLLRTGKLFLDFAGVSSEQVEVEADYFGLTGMLEILQKDENVQEIRTMCDTSAKRELIIYFDNREYHKLLYDVLDDVALPGKRTVLFGVYIDLVERPKLLGLERIEIEKRIHENWDFYWRQAKVIALSFAPGPGYEYRIQHS